LKKLLKKIESSLTTEDSDEIIGTMSGLKIALEKAKKQPTAAKKVPVAKAAVKSKKDKSKEAAEHAELLGFVLEIEYAAYEDEYDNLM
jgi:uncharacterized coiled-coil DUF342 family protein